MCVFIFNHSYLVHLTLLDWSKPPAVSLQRHMRGRRLNDDVGLRHVTFVYSLLTASSSLFRRRMVGQMILWQYTIQTDYHAFAKFTRWRHVARHAQPHEPSTRSLQWNAIRRAAGLLSPTSLLTDS